MKNLLALYITALLYSIFISPGRPSSVAFSKDPVRLWSWVCKVG